MKEVFTLILAILSFCTVNAMNPIHPSSKNISNMSVIDTGHVRIWYALNALDINKFETYDDLQRLEIGSGISKYFSHFVYNSDSLVTEWRKKNRNAGSAPRAMGESGKNEDWSEYQYSEYFKNFRKNTFTEYARMPLYIPCFQYTEAMPVQEWEIQVDTLTIAGFLCQKATCSFRGRNFTAWFAHDIPVSNGPWKFGGLPGLILRVYDDDKMYQVECIRIENHKQGYPIMIHDYASYKKSTRDEVWKLQKKCHEDYRKTASLVPVSGTPVPRDKTPYLRLELE